MEILVEDGSRVEMVPAALSIIDVRKVNAFNEKVFATIITFVNRMSNHEAY